MIPRALLACAAAVYLAVLVLGTAWPPALLAVIAIALAVPAGYARHAGVDPSLLLAGAWPPLHLLILATGGLGSPLLPIVIIWAAAWRWAGPPIRGMAALAVATAILTVVGWNQAVATGGGQLVPIFVVATVGGAVLWMLGGRTSGQAEAPALPEEEPIAPPERGDGRDMLESTLEFVRRATGSEDASLWQTVSGQKTIRRVARAADALVEPGPEEIDLEGHPFRWAIEEGMHVRLDPGRRNLPVPGAQGMLLVPLDAPGTLLVLAYDEPVPEWVEPAAHAASLHVAEVLSLIGRHRELDHQEGRLTALVDAVRKLPGELQPTRFAGLLAQVVVRATAAEGAAVAVWDADTGTGRVIGRAPEGPHEEIEVAAGASRLALALKHGTTLSSADLATAGGDLPLLGSTESWGRTPRAVVVRPLQVGGRIVGGLVAWHTRPGRFTASDDEVFDLLCSLAPLPMRNAQEYAALDRLASTDGLTGLPNRSSFETRLSALGHHFDRYARPFGLIVADVDHFKSFNDTYGHEAGDEVLREVAAVMQAAVRQVDLPARLGGEEFVVLLPETGLGESAEVAERIRRAVEAKTVRWQGRDLRVTLSLGVSACPEGTHRPSELLADADAALYRAKGNGRNRVASAQVDGVKSVTASRGATPDP